MSNNQIQIIYSLLNHWENWFKERGIDKNMPTCMVCGHPQQEQAIPNENQYVLAEAWANSSLSLFTIDKRIEKKNPGDADNHILICNKCINEVPEVKTKNAFLKWARKQDYFIQLRNRTENIIKHLGFGTKQNKFIEILRSNDFKIYAGSTEKIDINSSTIELLEVFLGYIEEKSLIDDKKAISEIKYIINNKDSLGKKDLIKHMLNLKKIKNNLTLRREVSL